MTIPTIDDQRAWYAEQVVGDEDTRDVTLDTSVEAEFRETALQWFFAWDNSPHGLDFWVNEYNRLRTGHDLSPVARWLLDPDADTPDEVSWYRENVPARGRMRMVMEESPESLDILRHPDGFSWSDSPHGGEFWYGVSQALEAGHPLTGLALALLAPTRDEVEREDPRNWHHWALPSVYTKFDEDGNAIRHTLTDAIVHGRGFCVTHVEHGRALRAAETYRIHVDAGDDLGNGLIAVPKVPTERMMEAGFLASLAENWPEDCESTGEISERIEARQIWNWMIAAAKGNSNSAEHDATFTETTAETYRIHVEGESAPREYPTAYAAFEAAAQISQERPEAVVTIVGMG